MAYPIDVLPELISLDVTAGLVLQGILAPWKAGATQADAETFAINVLDATNASPIVVTVAEGDLGVLAPRTADAEHGYLGRSFHVVIAGVLGNTAANKLSEKDQRNEAWFALVVDSTHLALYDLDNSTGALVASVGDGAYAGGGTIKRGLVDGRILVGREHIKELTSAPRIVFVPSSGDFGPADARSSFTAAAIAEGEIDRERTASPIQSELVWFDVHVWGRAPGGIFGITHAMAHQVIRSAHVRCMGCYETRSAEWIDQVDGAPQRVKNGHEYQFKLGLSLPINREAVILSPVDTTTDLTMYLQLAGDGIEAA